MDLIDDVVRTLEAQLAKASETLGLHSETKMNDSQPILLAAQPKKIHLCYASWLSP